MSLIDTYQIATIGQNSNSTFTLASNGILVDVTITPLPPIPIRPPGGSTGVQYKKKEIDRKKVTVVVHYEGKEYKETKIIYDKPELKVEDVNVEVSATQDKPKVKITVK